MVDKKSITEEQLLALLRVWQTIVFTNFRQREEPTQYAEAFLHLYPIQKARLLKPKLQGDDLQLAALLTLSSLSISLFSEEAHD